MITINFTRAAAIVFLIAGFLSSPANAQNANPAAKPSKAATAEPQKSAKECLARFALFMSYTPEMQVVYGFVDDKGDVRIEPKFKQVKEFSEGLAPAAVILGRPDYPKWGYINAEGKWILQPIFYDAMPFNEGLASVRDTVTGKYGVIDTKGRFVIPCQYDWIGKFSNGIAPFGVGTRENPVIGFIDKSGSIFLEPTVQVEKLNDDLLIFSDGLMPAKDGEKWGYINKKGVFVIPAKYGDASPFSEGFAFVETNGRVALIDIKGKMITAPLFDHGEYRNFYFKKRYMDRYQFTGGVSPVRLGGKWGLINTKGGYVLKPTYSEIFSFSEGLAKFYDDAVGGYGFLNTKGEVAIPAKKEFGTPNSFSNGLATYTIYDMANAKNNRNGIINKRGEVTEFKSNIQFSGSSSNYKCADR